MKRSHGLLAVSGLAAAVIFAGCSDDPASNKNTGTAGTSAGGTTGGATAGTSTTAGTATAGTFGTAGTEAGGNAGTGGTGGTAAGTAGTATAGTGGTVPVVPIVPTVFLIDNIRLQPYFPSEGGMGGMGGADFGGAPSDAGATGLGGADFGGAAGAGGADAGPLPDFLLTFDANVDPFKIHSDGFSPNVGGDTAGTPFIFDQTSVVWDAAGGKPGGAAKVSVPFTVKNQQADFGGTFNPAADLTGYELTADVKMTGTGDVGACATVWLYVYGGNGYANDKSGEPSQGVTSHLVKDEWKTVRLRLDGPYGYHSTANHPNFKPTLVTVWGAQFVTFGCP